MKPYYDDGQCVIYHGDCREVLPALDVSPDLLLTDPPYGIDIDTDYSRFGGGKVYAPVAGDTQAFDPAFLLGYPRVVLFGANHYADRLPPSGGWLVWDKVTANNVKTVLSDGELAWTNWLGNVRIYRHMWNGAYRATERDFFVHPTQKPIALMAWIIDFATDEGALVLDPFMGSGPALRAAKNLHRRAIGIEIEERYCEIAAKRLSQQTLGLSA